MARVLHKAADASTDAADHDELHAAAAIAELMNGEPFNAEYVIRWYSGLVKRAEVIGEVGQ